MTVILATPGGVGYGGRRDPILGTHTNDVSDHILALQLAGGYRIVAPETAEGGS